MAGDINRVTLVGRLTRDPELRHLPIGIARPRSSASPCNGRQNDEAGQLDRQAELLRRVGVRKPGRDALAAPREGPAHRHRRAARLVVEWEAQDGSKRSKVEIVAFQVQFLDSRGDDAGGANHSFPPQRPLTATDFAPVGRRRRHSLLGDEIRMAQTKEAGSARGARAARPARAAEELLLLQGQSRPRSTTRTTTSCGATSPRRARSAAAASRARAAATRSRSRSRSSARVRWRSCRTSPAASTMDVILLRTSSRSACAATSSPSRAATRGTSCCRASSPRRRRPARVAELRKRDAQRARHEARSFEEAQQIAETLDEDRAALRREGRADGRALRLGHADRRRGRDLADPQDPRRPAEDRLDTIKRIGRYDVPIEIFQDVTVDVKTLVVPEGGELPSEEELEAMEAAERRRGRGRRGRAAGAPSRPAEAVRRRARRGDYRRSRLQSRRPNRPRTTEPAAWHEPTGRAVTPTLARPQLRGRASTCASTACGRPPELPQRAVEPLHSVPSDGPVIIRHSSLQISRF